MSVSCSLWNKLSHIGADGGVLGGIQPCSCHQLSACPYKVSSPSRDPAPGEWWGQSAVQPLLQGGPWPDRGAGLCRLPRRAPSLLSRGLRTCLCSLQIHASGVVSRSQAEARVTTCLCCEGLSPVAGVVGSGLVTPGCSWL